MNRPIAEALKMSLTADQREMRDNLSSKSYWEKRWANDSDSVCADLMALYTVTGEGTREVIYELIEERFTHFESVFTENNKKMLELIMSNETELKELSFKRKADREMLNKHEHQISLLQTAQAHQSNQNEQQMALSRMTHSAIESLQTSVDSIALNTRVSSPSVIRKIPAIAWPVIGIVVIALISAATGYMSEFIGWLGTIKLFGGV